MLIDALELNRRLKGGEDLVIFDCRFDLMNPDKGLQAYRTGHIPGAHYLHLESDLSGPKSEHGGRHPLPDVNVFSQKLAAAGVGSDTAVVVYDGGEGMAPRAWWLLRYVGHDPVWVLNGGLGAWQREGLPLSAEAPAPKPKSFAVKVREDAVVSMQDVEQIVAGKREAVLIDARVAPRYRGETEPLDAKAGHIPGAKNAPWQDGLNADGTWKTGPLQAARFEKFPLNGDVVLYCGSGVTACVNAFAMELAGITHYKIYPGSFSDWSSYPNHAVNTGDE
ncbi:sulfurtransferase [Alicyclobacillus tolerans]|uniref:sulfurtransferase n=1 Tax=Alicyclobacillus tolerans TaxID=90970 RepID=UPI001F447C2E|nr:sulfurtransferase [Alicyclobacillus tolerans]MCF8564013.1 sulfurtransferase [Alicyclobacillus tolerans]